MDYGKYELVIGLEVHAQLLTQTKLFCGDSAAFGAEPNTQVSPITLGHPGTLPRLNRKAVEYAVRMGIACHCEIERRNYFARKNYFYPDLPKGYQITQHINPICKGGFLTVEMTEGEKKISLNRIHLEEDAGKSLHDVDPFHTSIDYNRAGVPLIEIVTEPDIRSSAEAVAFLTNLRKLLRFTGVCDGNMEEGSMRCDANVSVRVKGVAKLGTKVEVKNLNSIRNVKRAIEFEAKRLSGLLELGETIVQETRSFDANNGSTFSLRTKEDANDYRYFADPDLTPFSISNEFLESITTSMPALPEQLIKKYIETLMLSGYDASVICDDRDTAAYFEELINETPNFKAAANWMIGPVKSWLHEHNQGMQQFPVGPHTLAQLINLVEAGKVNFSIAAARILPVLAGGRKDPATVAAELNLVQDSDASAIIDWVDAVLEKWPDKVKDYKKGKKGLIGLFVGEVKKISNGKADPVRTNQLLLEKLNQ